MNHDKVKNYNPNVNSLKMGSLFKDIRISTMIKYMRMEFPFPIYCKGWTNRRKETSPPSSFTEFMNSIHVDRVYELYPCG